MISQDSRFDRSHHLIGVTGADADDIHVTDFGGFEPPAGLG
jgi:hypothetical protein